MAERFWIFEIHESDGNDNWITESFVRGENFEAARDKACDKIEEKLKKNGNEITYNDGDTFHNYWHFARKNSCPDGEECHKDRCSLDHRSWSVSVYFRENDEGSEEEPEGSRSHWHSWNGEIE